MKDEKDIDVAHFKTTLGVVNEDTIHVNNFPYHFEERDVRQLFKDCG